VQVVALVGWLVGAGAAVESLEVEVLPPAAQCRLGGFFSVVRHIRRKSAMGPYFCMWVDLGKNAKNRSILKPAECPTRYPRVGWYPLFLVFMCAFEALFISVNPFHAAPCSLLATYGVRVCLLFACGSRFEVRGSRFEVRGSRSSSCGAWPAAVGSVAGLAGRWSLVAASAGSRIARLEDRRLEDRRLEDRRLEDRRLEDRRLEDQQLRRVAGGSVAGGADPMPARTDSSPADRLVARLDRRPKGPNP